MGTEYKQFKDPIYGYITIPSDIVKNIIDTNVFQRLRRITQTSYSPLYPSAIHNRFVHSIGVYYLGVIACDSLLESIKDIKDIKEKCKSISLDRLREVFLLACLLHDVGHAPFSHTGEMFYLDDPQNGTQRYQTLYYELAKCVNTESFRKEIPTEESKSAAPHEVMSAIIGLSDFSDCFEKDIEKEFFARCITGHKYLDDYDEKSLYNCFISVLNSKVIDVDRLDYLIRDAYFTGFETTHIDYMRLLNSTIIVEVKDDHAGRIRYRIGYNKTAVSVIENVVYAHDAEKKWIQTHPTVLYDMYIIQHILNTLNRDMSQQGVKLFSRQALSPNGIQFNDSKISLLCDDDIVYLLKLNTTDRLFLEFFSRDKRRHPLWKSESEYKAYLSLMYSGKPLEKLEEAFDLTEKYVTKNTENWFIDKEVERKIRNELEAIKMADGAVDEKSKKIQIESKTTMLKLIECMTNYAADYGDGCSFVILKASNFYSGFNREEFGSIPIVFKNKEKDKVFDYNQVVQTLNSESSKTKQFSYLFFNNIDGKKFDKEGFCKALYQAFM